MAESRRKTDATAKLDDEAQKRRDRILLIVMLTIGVLLVIGMLYLAGFLSGN